MLQAQSSRPAAGRRDKYLNSDMSTGINQDETGAVYNGEIQRLSWLRHWTERDADQFHWLRRGQ